VAVSGTIAGVIGDSFPNYENPLPWEHDGAKLEERDGLAIERHPRCNGSNGGYPGRGAIQMLTATLLDLLCGSRLHGPVDVITRSRKLHHEHPVRQGKRAAKFESMQRRFSQRIAPMPCSSKIRNPNPKLFVSFDVDLALSASWRKILRGGGNEGDDGFQAEEVARRRTTDSTSDQTYASLDFTIVFLIARQSEPTCLLTEPTVRV